MGTLRRSQPGAETCFNHTPSSSSCLCQTSHLKGLPSPLKSLPLTSLAPGNDLSCCCGAGSPGEGNHAAVPPYSNAIMRKSNNAKVE